MALTVLQSQVARLALSLPEAASFCLVGGAAMISHGLVDRPTEDLDLFTTRRSDVAALAAALADALVGRGYAVVSEREFDTFVRLAVSTTDDSVRVDIALDARTRPPVLLEIGPVADVEELAADKVLALFGRAEPRDLVDIAALADRLSLPLMVDLAQEKDPGLEPAILGHAMLAAANAPDERFASLGVDPAALIDLRARAQVWAEELIMDPPEPDGH